jgi:hypothetical protein
MPDCQHTPTTAVLAAYQWALGNCFRCSRRGTYTAVVGELRRESDRVAVRACMACVLRLERDREQAARRYGWPYEPGDLSL